MMRQTSRSQARPGGILPLAALCMVGLVGSLALAIDIGMVAIARSQCQNAADSAAIAGVRTITGDSGTNYNASAAPGKAIVAANANTIMAKLVQGDAVGYKTVSTDTYDSQQVKIELGTYAYVYNDSSPGSEKFQLTFPRTDFTEPYSAVRSTVTYPDPSVTKKQQNYAFARVFGMAPFSTTAVATAIHRPRDVIIIMDLSGSMRFQSLPGINVSGTTANPSSNSLPRNKSMNPESIFPQFGHYADVSAAALQGTKSYSTGSEFVDPSNISTSSNSGPPICDDFYQNALGVAPGSGNKAFKRAPDSQDKTPGGYNYLKTSGNSGGSYAVTVKDIVGATTFNASFQEKGYDQYVTPKSVFYTEGPGYWGKTFFIWPPDPRGSFKDANNAANHADNGAKDWRQRFFFKVNGSNLGWLDHNTILFNSSGSGFKTPTTGTAVTENGVSVTYTYRINYAAIFHWLRNQDPKPFPPIIRAGRIKYYDAIPDPSDTTLNSRFWTTATLSNANERFWKEYIDFVLGLKGTGAGAYTNTQSGVNLTALIGNGDLFKWGSTAVQIKQKPDVTSTSTSYQSGTTSAAYAAGHAGAIVVKSALATTPTVGDYVYFGTSTTRYQVAAVNSATSITLNKALAAAVSSGATVKFIHGLYMDYLDNPYRPRHQYWFGPMTWVDWLGNYNTSQFWWPGNVHEAQNWACKVGIQAAIDDIKSNHPNDFIGMCFFSTPQSKTQSGQHNTAVVPLGRSYQKLKDSLWFPPTTITGGVTEITPYDTDFARVPRAKGGTAPGMGFLLAYNLLSSSATNLRNYPQSTYRGAIGGLGRKGAQRIIIFETDGAPNDDATATIVNKGSDSYYPIRLYNPGNYSDGKNSEWPTTNGGYADAPVLDTVTQICALETASPPGYGTKRKPVYVYPIGYGSIFDPANPSAGQTTALNFMQNVAYRGNTAADTLGANFPDERRIYGTNEQRIARMQTAFTNIMQYGIQVSLLE